MDSVLLFALPIILVLVLYAVQIGRAGGSRQWAEQRKEQAKAQGGTSKVLMRTVVTVLAVLLVMTLIQFLAR
jgi:predicted RND superfamily exporter protein